MGQNGYCLGKVWAGTLAEAASIMITGAIRTTPTKVQEMSSDQPLLGAVAEAVALRTAYATKAPRNEA